MNYKEAIINPPKGYKYNLFGQDISKPLEISDRILYHNMIEDTFQNKRQKRCGCVFYEEHLVNCCDHPISKLKNYDPNVKQTYIQQALDRVELINAIKKSVRVKRSNCKNPNEDLLKYI